MGASVPNTQTGLRAGAGQCAVGGTPYHPRRVWEGCVLGRGHAVRGRCRFLRTEDASDAQNSKFKGVLRHCHPRDDGMSRAQADGWF